MSGDNWILCRERCKNYNAQLGRCRKGVEHPPATRAWPIPPEGCLYFEPGLHYAENAKAPALSKEAWSECRASCRCYREDKGRCEWCHWPVPVKSCAMFATRPQTPQTPSAA